MDTALPKQPGTWGYEGIHITIRRQEVILDQAKAVIKLNEDILEEAKILIEQWRQEYNQVRPRSAKNYRPLAPETIWYKLMGGQVNADQPYGQMVAWRGGQ